MAVLPLRTERLALRVMQPADAPALAAYRADPEIARYQDWDMPYTLEMAAAALEGQAGVTDVLLDDWVQVAIEHEGEIVGDLAVGMQEGGQRGILGYTLAPAHHGRGFAAEAAGAMVDALFAGTPLVRLLATLDPENTASMRVAESIGFTYEGTARKGAFVRGEWVDDARFALLREDREAWLARPRSAPADVRLVEIDDANSRAYGELRTHRWQEQLVAPVLQSYRQALFPFAERGHPVLPWLRGIEADGEPAGFVMLADVTEGHPEPYLWRLLVDRRHQRRGIGERALALVLDRLRARGDRRVLVSWVPIPGGPEPFYRRLGFAPTGEMDEDEVVAALVL